MKIPISLFAFLLLLKVTRSQHTASEQEKRRETQRKARQKRQPERRKQRRQQSQFGRNEEARFNFTKAYESAGSLFPTQAPRDAIEGSLRAIRSTLVASLTGVAAVVVFPFALAANLGLWGFPLGALLGGLSGVSIFLAGTASGIYQFLLGVKNTPEACQATWQGKQWDADTRSWKVYSLSEESKELLSEKIRDGRVRDLSFYELLGVETSATGKEIKRAYYQKAKELHPDKNPDDKEAAEMFVMLHEAYQTLSDEKLRLDYDQYGTSSTDQHGSNFYFNADIFFEVLFGLEPEVELYVGKLTVATFVAQMMRLYEAGIVSEETWLLFREESNLQARKRHVEIASNLLRRIEPFVQGKMTVVEFRSSCAVEAERMAKSVFGTGFLKAIGRSLQFEAAAYLNFRRVVVGWPVSMFLTLKRKYQRWGGHLDLIRRIWQVLKVVIDGTEVIEGESKARVTNDTIMNALPVVLEMAWAHNAGDIAFTLEMACQKVFQDADATNGIRNLRAEAILMLGQEFSKTAASKARKTDNITCDGSNMQSQDIEARVVIAYHIATMNGSRKQDFEEMIQRQSSKNK